MGPLLETKLHRPGGADARISRPRLCERLDRGAEASLTVVSAPAGFGKTTVVAEWLDSLRADRAGQAWLSLDERDDDPVTFWTYVVAALSAAVGGGGVAGTAALLQSRPAALDAVVTTLLNELAALDREVILVLDDYHLITAPEVHESVAFLLERLPLPVRVVLATRADPPFSLGRLRVGGRLVEVRAGDLRFTADETAAYLDRAGGATLSDDEVAVLAERTEGWAAALQLAALSMDGRDDVSSFIAGFAGDDRYIVDYLAEEVLDRQPDEVRQFLLRTSILDRLNGPLCDAVTGFDDGRRTLERLERANMFLVPLDDRRQWYRYHHLFADVLVAHLVDEQPEAVAELHRRAGEWHASNGTVLDGLHHAMAAGDLERAADLVEVTLPAWRRDRQESTMSAWLQRLPDEVVRARPVLMVGVVGVMVGTAGYSDEGNRRLDEAERLLDLAAADPSVLGRQVVIADEAQARSLPGAIEMYRAGLALIRHDLDATRLHGRRSLEVAPADDDLVRGAAATLVGLASWACGDVAGAAGAYAESMEGLRRAGHLSDVLGCSIALADLSLAQGRLREARRVYAEGLALGTSQDGIALRGTADMYVGLSEVHRELGDLDAARDHLRRSADLGEHNGLPQHPYRSRLAQARLCADLGDVDAALDLLDDAERRYTTDFSPSVRPIPAVRAGLLADHGRVAEAMAWVRQRGLGPDDELDYLTEFEHLTLARVLVAQHRAAPSSGTVEGAVSLLERLSVAAEAGGRIGSLLQVLVLQAVAEEVRGDRPAAIAHLERAVERAEAEGHVRLFLDEGRAIRLLLEVMARGGPSASYVGRLLGSSPERTGRRGRPQHLVDPLSDRELEVLRLLDSELTGPEIARELIVSINTVRTHTKSIYSKLGVTSRRAAVRRAGELELLPRSARD